MGEIKRLIHEIHRRSLWQVLGIFLAASWDQAVRYYREYVEQMSNGAGLPRVDRARERISALASGD